MQVRRPQAWLNTVIDLMCVFPSRLYRTNQVVEYVEYRGLRLIMEIFSQVETFNRHNHGSMLAARIAETSRK